MSQFGGLETYLKFHGITHCGKMFLLLKKLSKLFWIFHIKNDLKMKGFKKYHKSKKLQFDAMWRLSNKFHTCTFFLLTEMPYLDTNYAEENLKTISCLTSFLSLEVNIKTKSKSQQDKSKHHSVSKIIKKSHFSLRIARSKIEVFEIFLSRFLQGKSETFLDNFKHCDTCKKIPYLLRAF